MKARHLLVQRLRESGHLAGVTHVRGERFGSLGATGHGRGGVGAVKDDLVLHRHRKLDFHSNGMVFTADGANGTEVNRREYCSVGAGFVLDEDDAGRPVTVPDSTPVPYPFTPVTNCWRSPPGPGCGSAMSC